MSEQLYVAITSDGYYLKQRIMHNNVAPLIVFESVTLNDADAKPKRFRLNPLESAPKHILLPVIISRAVTIITESV